MKQHDQIAKIKNKILVIMVTLTAMGIFVNTTHISELENQYYLNEWQDKWIFASSGKYQLSSDSDSVPNVAICKYRLKFDWHQGNKILFSDYSNKVDESVLRENYFFNSSFDLKKISPRIKLESHHKAFLVGTFDKRSHKFVLGYSKGQAQNYEFEKIHKDLKITLQERCSESIARANPDDRVYAMAKD